MKPIVNPHKMSQPQGFEARLPIPPPDYVTFSAYVSFAEGFIHHSNNTLLDF
jgi:hypothetical protein